MSDYVRQIDDNFLPKGEKWRLVVSSPTEDSFTDEVEVAFERVASSNPNRALTTLQRLTLNEDELAWLVDVLPKALAEQRALKESRSNG